MTHKEALNDVRDKRINKPHTDCEGEMRPGDSIQIYDEVLIRSQCQSCGKVVAWGMHTLAHERQ
jgi:hypothetical protein